MRMKKAVLNELEEDWTAARKERGALYHIHAALKDIRDGVKRGSNIQVLSDHLSREFTKKPGFTLKDFPLTGAMRADLFHEVAINIWNWRQSFLDRPARLAKDDRKSKMAEATTNLMPLTTDDDEFQYWAEQWNHYTQQAAVLMPFGRNRGKSLGLTGKRSVRWLRERLLPEATAKKILDAVRVLLAPKGSHTRAQMITAGRVQLPYRRFHRNAERPITSRRRPRGNLLAQYEPYAASSGAPLSAFGRPEWKIIEREMCEQVEYAPKFREISAAVDLFLSERPPPFPVGRVKLSTSERAVNEKLHYQALRSLARPIHGDIEASEELLLRWEDDTKAKLLRAEGQLLDEFLQPLSYSRSMRPSGSSSYTAGGVLFDERTHQFVLALQVPGEKAPQVDGFLRFANFPESHFRPSERQSILLFPLATGQDYHNAIFSGAVSTARAAQLTLAATPEHRSQRLAEVLPTDVPFGPVTVSTQVAERGHIKLFAHIPIHVSVSPSCELPTTFMGVHESDEGRYSYVIVALAEQRRENGRLVHAGETITQGDIQLKAWADPLQAKGLQPRKTGERKQSNAPPPNNYVFEVATALVDVAQQHNAMIGLEDTGWKKAQASTQASLNHRTYSRPSRRIAEIVHYKALLAGLPTVRDVGNVSPVNDCGQCGVRLRSGVSRNQSSQRTHCPSCKGDVSPWTDGWCYCPCCRATWPSRERWFHCEQCHTHVPTRQNLALVVARQGLQQMMEHHTRWKIKKLVSGPGAEAPDGPAPAC